MQSKLKGEELPQHFLCHLSNISVIRECLFASSYNTRDHEHYNSNYSLLNLPNALYTYQLTPSTCQLTKKEASHCVFLGNERVASFKDFPHHFITAVT